MASLAQRHGDGHPPPGAAGPVAGLLAEGGPIPPPAGAGGGPGAPGRVPVPPIRHVPGGPRSPHGCQPHGPGGPRGLPVPDQLRPRPRNPYPWDDLVGPLPGDTVRNQPRLRLGAPPGWRWPQDLVRWARALAWMPGPAEVSWAQLALDYEAFCGAGAPSLPGSPAAGYTPAARGASPSPAQGCGPGGAPPCGGHAVVQGPAGALPLAPPPRGPIGRPVFRGAPQGDAAANAPRDALPRLVGPAPPSACPHAAAAGRPFSHGLLPPSP